MEQKTDISTLSLALMGLIVQQPQSGYDIRKTFATTPMGHFSNSPGAIYPALKRLEKDGWIRGKVDDAQALRPRKVYEMTPRGRGVLKRYLRRPVTRDDVIWRMDDLMLRFALMDGIVGRAATLGFLDSLARELEAYVAHLRSFLADVGASMPAVGRLAMEQGIESYAVNAAWARRAIKELETGA
ncbi:MAG: helix-turn-helix transcriptional regulator [Phycisphaerales bacterium]|nr:MAG: helix-turn-helix transcriptional regulator [Phycisphaerales bacterium]